MGVDIMMQWPSIEIGKETYNPTDVSGEILTELKKSGVQPLYKISTANRMAISAVNSKRELIGKKRRNNTDIMKMCTTGEVQLFCRLPPEDTEEIAFRILSLAIDEEDNVYIVTRCKATDYIYHYKLFIFDAKGNLKHQCLLQIWNGKKVTHWRKHSIAITKDKNIITYGFDDKQIHVHDSSGELKYSFPTKEINVALLSISDENEIIPAQRGSQCVYIYTEEGNEKKKFEVLEDHKVLDVAFNHVTKAVIVLTRIDGHELWISSYSTTGEKRKTVRSFAIECMPSIITTTSLTSHPSAPVVLVQDQSVLYIQ